MPERTRIAPCLWFDGKAEEAAEFYLKLFPDSRITGVSRYSEAGKEIHGQVPGSVLTVELELMGQPFSLLNGGPMFVFNEAISFQIDCDSQEELDKYYDGLLDGDRGSPSDCGWVKDPFGVSWQIAPTSLREMMLDPDSSKRERVMTALFTMKRLDLAALERAFAGS